MGQVWERKHWWFKTKTLTVTGVHQVWVPLDHENDAGIDIVVVRDGESVVHLMTMTLWNEWSRKATLVKE